MMDLGYRQESHPAALRGSTLRNRPTASAILAVSIAAHALGTIVLPHATTPAPRNRP